ncbi:hypothetical protein ACN5ZK_13290 (plasmid) [Macrococcoides bohemicum]|uniref:hypothetical protein n=1 Tax=Macrococcoides bohemicum TaxID=1903056 RepID=UPI003B007243
MNIRRNIKTKCTSKNTDEFINHEKYDDVISYENMPFQQILHYLYTGREIEFIYNDKEYFIGNFKKGRALCNGNEDAVIYYDDNMNMIKNEKIDNRTLEDIFKNGSFTIEHIL